MGLVDSAPIPTDPRALIRRSPAGCDQTRFSGVHYGSPIRDASAAIPFSGVMSIGCWLARGMALYTSEPLQDRPNLHRRPFASTSRGYAAGI
jgi:hypothetical protein